MIILHFHLQPQFIDELFRIYITSLLCFCFFILSIYTCIIHVFVCNFESFSLLCRFKNTVFRTVFIDRFIRTFFKHYLGLFLYILFALAFVSGHPSEPCAHAHGFALDTPVAMRLRATKKHGSEGLGQNFIFLNPQMDSIQKFVL